MYTSLMAVAFLLLATCESKPFGSLRKRQDATNGVPANGVPANGVPVTGVPATSVPATGTATSPTNGSTLVGGSACGGFKNTVFNTGAAQDPGFPSTTWTSLSGAGVSNWIGFSLKTLDTAPSYNNIPTSPEFNAAQIPLMMDIRDVDEGYAMVTGPNPPAVLGLFNEPDFSFQGKTPTLDTQAAGQALARFLSAPHPNTKYLTPAPADAGWLRQFKQQFPQYFQPGGFDIVSIHAYNPDPQVIIQYVQDVHASFPEQNIWVTELSPVMPGCSLSPQQVKDWMQAVVTGLRGLGYVEKIFWNCGEQGVSEPGAEGCNPSLTTDAGQLTELGQLYAQVC